MNSEYNKYIPSLHNKKIANKELYLDTIQHFLCTTKRNLY
jgi:hypothetical protein